MLRSLRDGSAAVGRDSVVAATLLVVLSWTAACSGPAKPPNIVLVTVDTLRADHLESWGYQRMTSPAISALAERGVRFANAVSQAPWTLPSMAALHTSLYPSQHRAWKANSRLDEGTKMLAERLRGAGYYTVGVVSHVFVAGDRGFARGFDVFDESQIKVRQMTSTSPKLTEIALELLRDRDAESREKPFFLWVHYFDPHYAYVRHEEFAFAQGAAPLDRFDFGSLRRLSEKRDEAGRPAARPEDIEYVEAVHDEEIAYTDAAIGELLKGSRSLGSGRPTVVFLTADHGEFFMERGEFGHHQAVVYQALVHVPLVIGGDIARELRGRVVEAPVEVASIAKTLGVLAGLEPDLFQGSDLLEIARRPEDAPAAYTEACSAWGRNDEMVAVLSGDWKLIHNRTRGIFELYRLSSDPNETENRWSDSDSSAGAARQRLARLLDGFRPRRKARARNVELNSEQMKHLRELGYTE